MNKRKFLEIAGKTSFGLFASPYFLENASFNPLAKKNTKNWIWARPKEQSIELWKKDLEKVKKTGFDAVLLEVYNGNTTYFENNKFPVKEALLEKLIPICKEIG
nr:Tat pathway signal protein [Flammeovirgaceae bacterium]